VRLTPGGAAALWGWRGTWIPAHLRRRILAAMLAAAAIVMALGAFHRPARAPRATAAQAPSAGLLGKLHPGQVAAPVRLVDPGVAPLLHPGMSVDVLAAPDSPSGSGDAGQSPARIVSQRVRVLAVATPKTGDTSTLVVLAVSREDAQALAGAESGGRLSVTLESG
jgi:Flp pilus assembly protein RcpC/CpaB